MSSFYPIETVRKLFRQDADYLESNKERIQEQNTKMLRVSCLIYICVLLFYTFDECVSGSSRLLIGMYFAFNAAEVYLHP